MNNPRQHAGRVAVVTGAASGIGLQVAQDLSAQGATVCIVDRNGPAAQAAADSIVAAGGQAHAYVADLGDTAAIEATLQQLQ
jgi:NAD(P)-dependent dehydrogenase (short-subunit alcohol dehydrogenase family)